MATEDILINDGDSFLSLSALAAEQVNVKLPIESDDGTVVLDSPSANTFIVSTGGAERFEVQDNGTVVVEAATLLCGTEWNTTGNAINEIFAVKNLKSYADNGVVNYIRTDDTTAGNIYWYDVNLDADQKTNASVGAGGFTINTLKTLGFTGDGINFASNTLGDASTVMWEMKSDGGFIGTASGYIKTPTVSGPADNDASIALGANATITVGVAYYQIYKTGYHIFQSDGSQSRFTNDGDFLIGTQTPFTGDGSVDATKTVVLATGKKGIARWSARETSSSQTVDLYLSCDYDTSEIVLNANSQVVLEKNDGSDYTPIQPNSIATKKYVLDNAGESYDDTQIKADLASEVSAREAADTTLQNNITDLIWIGTQQEYDALGIYRNQTLYCITTD